MKPGLWRKLFLGLVILFGVSAIFCSWQAYMITKTVIAFFLLPIVITISVLGLEVFSVIVTKKTLSTDVTKALEEYKKARFWIWATLISLILVLVFLVPHLVITGN